MTVTLLLFPSEHLTHVFDPMPRKCQCGSTTGTLLFREGRMISIQCQGCKSRHAATLVRTLPLRKPCPCGATLGSPGFIAPLGPHQSLYCLSCGAWNWHVARADLANL